MRKSDHDAARGVELSRASTASFKASRRHLALGLAALGTAAVLRSQRAVADASPQGCLSSGNQPNSCCFIEHTMILTPQGERAIEELGIGDEVLTASGASRPVRWIGRLRFARKAGEEWSAEAMPIRIAAGAFADAIPSRDLYVSGAHAFLIEGKLVSAMNLVNGTSIRRCPEHAGAEIKYFHIELASHDVVWANGAPAETLLAGENRRGFLNFDEYVSLYGPSLTTLLPYAPYAGTYGGKDEIASRLRSALAPVIDVRRPFERIRDAVAERGRRAA